MVLVLLTVKERATPFLKNRLPAHRFRGASRDPSETPLETFLGLFERAKKTHREKKTRKQNFHGIVLGFWGEFCLCVYSPPQGMTPPKKKEKKTHKQLFGTHPVPGQSRKFVYVYVFFLSLIFEPGQLVTPVAGRRDPNVWWVSPTCDLP